ncbi:glutathione S-transferase family protein [Microcoleus sp. OTE_8_concoct_300]|uniref:glutathione S-transferase family protein n=1 Tax=Microcoleus sp. OTE_8_concoct_300 TaxID=2964710 RepID=UPI00403F43CD
MSKLVVYGTPASTYVRTVRLLLEEIAVDYTLHRVDILNGENKSAEYLAKNPFGKVPTIEVNGELLYETAVITEYLDTTLADRKFSFSELMLQARMRQIIGKLGRNPVLLARLYKSCWYQQKFRCKIDSVAKLNVCT